ncbi:MAG: molybdopterin molybdotransferase MoeA [Candidatus Eutrophobiaceae bacterium]
MNKFSASCQDDFDLESLSPNKALEIMLAEAPVAKDTEILPLRQTLHRVLAQDIISKVNVPSARNSAMDGYALNGADLLPLPDRSHRDLTLKGTAWAGKPFQGTLAAGECVRIMTGAVMPECCDTVVIQERAEILPNGHIRIEDGSQTGDNVRQAGEDIRKGDAVLPIGTRIGAAELGVMASAGMANLAVYQQPRVAFLSTGDELQTIDTPLKSGMIHDSNRHTLFGMLSEMGVLSLDMGIVADHPDTLRAAIDQASKHAQLVITTGGVSVGEADFVKQTLSELGNMQLWKIAMKPGRPLGFGRIGDALFFGLPGNPVSVMVTFLQFVKPTLEKMMGISPYHAPLLADALCLSRLRKRSGRMEYQRGWASQDEHGRLVVAKTGMQGSGILKSMTLANCLIILPIDNEGVAEGDTVKVQLL